jgi:hypothetical protein
MPVDTAPGGKRFPSAPQRRLPVRNDVEMKPGARPGSRTLEDQEPRAVAARIETVQPGNVAVA